MEKDDINIMIMGDKLFIQFQNLDKINYLIIIKMREVIIKSLKLFIRGKAISGDPNIIGIKKFPNPPIIKGITIKKINKNA